MNKKGFVFVETITVVCVLMVALLTIYTTYSKILSSEKKRMSFDDTAYIYRTYYIEDFLVSLNMDQYVKKYLIDNNRLIAEFQCSDASLYNYADDNGNMIESEKKKNEFCEKTLSTSQLNVKHIYIVRNSLNNNGDKDFGIKSCFTKNKADGCNTDDYKNMSANLISYIKTIRMDNDYRIIVEYEEIELDSNNTKNPSDNICPKNYEKVNNICQKKIIKNYYNSVKLQMRVEE